MFKVKSKAESYVGTMSIKKEYWTLKAFDWQFFTWRMQKRPVEGVDLTIQLYEHRFRFDGRLNNVMTSYWHLHRGEKEWNVISATIPLRAEHRNVIAENDRRRS